MTTKRGPGRPSIMGPNPKRVTVRLGPEEHDALQKFAEERFWEVSAAIRLIIRERLLEENLPAVGPD